MHAQNGRTDEGGRGWTRVEEQRNKGTKEQGSKGRRWKGVGERDCWKMHWGVLLGVPSSPYSPSSLQKTNLSRGCRLNWDGLWLQIRQSCAGPGAFVGLPAVSSSSSHTHQMLSVHGQNRQRMQVLSSASPCGIQARAARDTSTSQFFFMYPESRNRWKWILLSLQVSVNQDSFLRS